MKLHRYKSYESVLRFSDGVIDLNESFVPKKLDSRREDLIKKYTKDNSTIKKYVLGKGSYIAPRNNFETSSSLRDRMESKDDYTHSVTGEVFYFISKKESVELPIKAVDWKMWVEKLSKIGVNENGHIEEDFESYDAGDDTLSACLWWIGWYFEVTDEEIRREFNEY